MRYCSMLPRGFGIGPLVAILNIGSKALGRQIVDQTGLAGGFDIDLTYTPDALSAAALASRQGPPPPLASQVDPNGPSLFQALQDQLGLKVEPRKLAPDVMLIDHIEPPTEE